jgi:hypothetical protein
LFAALCWSVCCRNHRGHASCADSLGGWAGPSCRTSASLWAMIHIAYKHLPHAGTRSGVLHRQSQLDKDDSPNSS